MTDEQVDSIRARWGLIASRLSAEPKTQAAADIQQLLAELERLQLACAEITRQYARMCERCANRQRGYCELDDQLSLSVVPVDGQAKLTA